MEKLDEVMGLTMVDDLTKLYNSRYFEERLLESVNRVERFAKPLALIFMRLELPANMEKEAKEMILKEVALRLSKNTRVYDVNSRFEGATFASIIHEVGEKETKIVIKRIKEAMEQKEIAGKVAVHRSFIEKFLNFSPRLTKNYATYVRIVIAAELYKTGKVGISELMQKGAILLDEAETAKNQIKFTVIRGKK
jgi:diguanylate cyclase (GGDEF)-like protein